MAENALEEAPPDISSCLGFKIQLKSEQRESIVHLLRGEDVLAILPTGYGKSFIFQLLLSLIANVNHCSENTLHNGIYGAGRSFTRLHLRLLRERKQANKIISRDSTVARQ
jgi:superfamily II DNA/RNA helicase